MPTLFRPLLCAAIALVAPLAQAETLFSDNLDEARAHAKTSHKDILVDITGSDWCGYCKLLDKQIFETPLFKETAPKSFELVQLDFPSERKQKAENIPAETMTKRKAWKREIQSGSFPDVLVLDETGRVYARTGYRIGGADPFLQHVEELRSRRVKRDAARALAAKTTGAERAAHLDAALTALDNDELMTQYYAAERKEIMQADPKLGAKYTEIARKLARMRHVLMLYQEPDAAKKLESLKAFAADTKEPVEARQSALRMAASSFAKEEAGKGVEMIDEAVALDPNSQYARNDLRQARLFAEERVAKAATAKKPRAAHAEKAK